MSDQIANQPVLGNEANSHLINQFSRNLYKYHPYCQELLNNYKMGQITDIGYFSNFTNNFQNIITQCIIDCKTYGNKHARVRYHHIVRPQVKKTIRGDKEDGQIYYRLTYELPRNARHDFLESIFVGGLDSNEIESAELELKNNTRPQTCQFLLTFKKGTTELVMAADTNKDANDDLRPIFVPRSKDEYSAKIVINVIQNEMWPNSLKRNFSLVANYCMVDAGVFGYITRIQMNDINVMPWNDYVELCKQEDGKHKLKIEQDLKNGFIRQLTPGGIY